MGKVLQTNAGSGMAQHLTKRARFTRRASIEALLGKMVSTTHAFTFCCDISLYRQVANSALFIKFCRLSTFTCYIHCTAILSNVHVRDYHCALFMCSNSSGSRCVLCVVRVILSTPHVLSPRHARQQIHVLLQSTDGPQHAGPA